VGPAGVFSVETKNWRGEVTVEDGYILVDGRLPSRAPLAQAVKEASLVKAQLERLGWKGDVTPVLAFASNSFKSRLAEIGGAVVMNADELKASFAGGRSVIPQQELDRLSSLMENRE